MDNKNEAQTSYSSQTHRDELHRLVDQIENDDFVKRLICLVKGALGTDNA